jgi:hypothetical protein
MTSGPSLAPAPAAEPTQCLLDDLVELTDVPEAEGPKEGAEGGGRHYLVAEHLLGLTGPQHPAVVDRVGAATIAWTIVMAFRPGRK